MFNRKYAARDRRKPRGLIAKLHLSDVAAHRDKRQSPLPDVGFDAVDLGLVDDHLDQWIRRYYIDEETWLRYTTPQPFCIVPQGGSKPMPQGGLMPTRNPFRRPTEKSAELSLVKSFSDESKRKLSDELPPEPTREDIIARAGGRAVSLKPVPSVSDWHELDA